MLPTLHPFEKTVIELKRCVQRLEHYLNQSANDNEENVLEAIALLKEALKKI
jgi:hypothetical protein